MNPRAAKVSSVVKTAPFQYGGVKSGQPSELSYEETSAEVGEALVRLGETAVSEVLDAE